MQHCRNIEVSFFRLHWEFLPQIGEGRHCTESSFLPIGVGIGVGVMLAWLMFILLHPIRFGFALLRQS